MPTAGGAGGLEDLVGGEERSTNPATAGEGRQFGEDEARVGVGREAGLDGLEVQEFLGVGVGGGEKKRGGEAGGDEGFAEGGVGGADEVGGK